MCGDEFMNMFRATVHWSRSAPWHHSLRSEIIEVCGCLRRSRPMTPIPAKDRDSHLFHQPMSRSRQVTRRIHQEHPPPPRLRCGRRATEARADNAFQFGQPEREPPPVAAQERRVASHFDPLGRVAEVALDSLIADEPIRLREVRQQADRAAARPATKSPHRNAEMLAIGARQPALVIPKSHERFCCRTIGTANRSRHSALLLREEMVLRRPFHPDNDLQNDADLCTNVA